MKITIPVTQLFLDNRDHLLPLTDTPEFNGRGKSVTARKN